MKFYECKVEYFDDGAENNTGIWLGYVCAKDYSDAAKKVCDSWEDVILSMSLLETECVDLLDYDACNDFYWKEKELCFVIARRKSKETSIGQCDI